jgi:hypothetical protein
VTRPREKPKELIAKKTGLVFSSEISTRCVFKAGGTKAAQKPRRPLMRSRVGKDVRKGKHMLQTDAATSPKRIVGLRPNRSLDQVAGRTPRTTQKEKTLCSQPVYIPTWTESAMDRSIRKGAILQDEISRHIGQLAFS